MRCSQNLRDLKERKLLLVAKADLQRSSFQLIVSPVLKIVRAVDVAFIAVKTGRAISRHVKHLTRRCP